MLQKLVYQKPPKNVMRTTIYINCAKDHCVKSVQIRNYFWFVFSCIRIEYGDLRSKIFNPNTGKYRPEITPYLDTSHAVNVSPALSMWGNSPRHST